MITLLVLLVQLLFASTLVTGMQQQQQQQRNLTLLGFEYDEPRNCNEWTEKIDNMDSIDNVKQYVLFGLERPRVVHLIWYCLGKQNITQRLPTDIYHDKEFVFGDGDGYLFPIKRIPLWNKIQPLIGGIFWGGKLFQNRTSNRPSNSSSSTSATAVTGGGSQTPILKNLMDLEKKMSYFAESYESLSMVDNKHCIQLDYRKDTTRRVISFLVHNVRDEIREIIWRNVSTAIYYGRANYFIRRSKKRFLSSYWNKDSNFILPASFILDFRQKKQSLIPSWASQWFP